MGAWLFLKTWFGDSLFGRLPLSGITRPASASPATGSHSSHKKEQELLIAACVRIIASNYVGRIDSSIGR